MINKKKRYALLTLGLPFNIVAFIINIVVALVVFLYMRLIHRGILMGTMANKSLEFHEQGKVRQ